MKDQLQFLCVTHYHVPGFTPSELRVPFSNEFWEANSNSNNSGIEDHLHFNMLHIMPE